MSDTTPLPRIELLINIEAIESAILNAGTTTLSTLCQFNNKQQIIGNVGNYPAMSVPRRVSSAMANHLTIDTIRYGVVVRVIIDPQYQDIAQQIWGNNQYGLFYIGSVSPLGFSGRDFNVYQGKTLLLNVTFISNSKLW